MKRFGVGILLVATASAALLLSDLGRAGKALSAKGFKRIAIFQYSSRPVLDDTVAGVLEGLRSSGYNVGQNLQVAFYNPEGSAPDAAVMARAITDGGFDLAVTVSTPCLQVLAEANRDGRVPHVFCCVTDPFAAGVGLSAKSPAGRPPHLTGIGTFQPVRELFLRARGINPSLRRVGVVWCPSEACAEQCLTVARKVCAELDIILEEVTVNATAEVLDAARALASRDVQAIWTGGDNLVESTFPGIVQACREARIPCFTNAPAYCEQGALFSLGADYYAVGKLAGGKAARILAGGDPAREPVESAVPEQLAVNLSAAEGLSEPWAIPPDVLADAGVVIDRGGTHRKAEPLARRWRIHVVTYSDSFLSDETLRGIREGLPEAGLVERRDYTLTLACAQGDMATLPSLFDAARVKGVDLYLVVSTPTLQAAVQKVMDTPVVFCTVADPVKAGAGRSAADHLPNITGISTLGPYPEMAQLLHSCFPAFRRVGTLFCPVEVNSVLNKEIFSRECRARGIEVIAVPANTPEELSYAAEALCSRRPDAVVQVIDNLTAAGFDGLAAAARRARIPLFSHTSDGVRKGAALGICRDYSTAGREAALTAARIMRGDLPSRIPFRPAEAKVIIVDLQNARKTGLAIPETVLAQASEIRH
ncbi:MAG: ABC transporter substrate-binding protein [Acidobacteria bacterium]|nr:ABC transporter substrate-binding protein [Acidobacteriota bacterium]